MAMASSTIHLPLPLPIHSTKRSLLAPCAAHRNPDAASAVELPHHQEQRPKSTINLPSTLSNLLHLHLTPKLENSLAIALPADRQSPTESPREDVSSLCSELHGSDDWSHLLNPLHRWLCREIIKYGEFAQATYDAFDFNPFSEYCGNCLYNRRHLFHKLGLPKLEPLGSDHGDVKVEHGFLSIYTSKSNATRYNKSSTSEQVMEEIQRLVRFYRERGEQVSLTITGHSLGGMLALLNATRWRRRPFQTCR